MTRFLKVSLIVVAFLLVGALAAFSAYTIFFEEDSSVEALTAAEEAKQAVTDATADLEKAIANKADASKLADSVDALTKAIQSAELLAVDGDSALKAAIATAKLALNENAQAIVNALDVKIAGLLAEKTDKAVVDAELARFEAIINNINEATGAYIQINDFVSFSSQAAMYAYELERKFYRMEEISYLYGENWENIEKAYAIAKVVIYRATGIEVINSALDQFEKAVKENASEADKVYYDIVAYSGGGIDAEKVYKRVSELYAQAVETETTTDDDIIEDYYGKGNLVLEALELWRAQLSAEMTAVGALYVVNPENEKYNDSAFIKEVEASQGAFSVAVASCNEWFGGIEDIVPSQAYTDNVNRNAAMVNAVKDADAVIKLGVDYAKDFAEAELTQENVDALTAWKNAYDAWIRAYLPALQGYQLENAEYTARYNAVAALIAPTEGALEEAIDLLAEKTVGYVKNANTMFVNSLTAAFYTSSNLDLNRVTILSETEITKIKMFAKLFVDTYGEPLVLPSFAYESSSIVRPNEAYDNLARIEADFNSKAEAFVENYNTLPNDAANAAITAGALNIYDTSAKEVLDGVGAIAWGSATQVVLCDVTIEKSYFDTLAVLEAARQELLAFVQAKNNELDDAVEELEAANTVAAYNAASTKISNLLAAYKTGEYSDLPVGATAALVAYDAEKTNSGTLANGESYDLSIDEAKIIETDAKVKVYATFADALNRVETLRTSDDFFDEEGEKAADKATYGAACEALKTALIEYVEVFGEEADADLVYNANIRINESTGLLS